MKENLTEIIFILDRSGSMQSLTQDTIGGFNSFIEKQKELPGEALVTVVMFDDQYEFLYDGVNIQSLPILTTKEYFARGTTALLDAIGKTINIVGVRLSNLAEEERPSKVLMIITTDGKENASKEFTYDAIKRMIDLQSNTYSWEFIFLGADLSAVDYSIGLGVKASNAYFSVQSADGVQSSYLAMSKATTSYRSCGVIDEDWKDEIKTE